MSQLISFYNIEPLTVQHSDGISVMAERYFIFRDFLASNKGINRCFLTDSRDVIFQSSPFSIETPHLYLYSEPVKFSQCEYNGPWISKYYGDDLLSRVSENLVLCAGTTLGSYDLITQYVDRMCSELHRHMNQPQELVDQPMHNFLYYTGQLPSAEVRAHGFSEVQTLHHEKVFSFDSEGFLLNRDGSRVPVIHQYDRHKQYFPKFEQMLNRQT